MMFGFGESSIFDVSAYFSKTSPEENNGSSSNVGDGSGELTMNSSANTKLVIKRRSSSKNVSEIESHKNSRCCFNKRKFFLFVCVPLFLVLAFGALVRELVNESKKVEEVRQTLHKTQKNLSMSEYVGTVCRTNLDGCNTKYQKDTLAMEAAYENIKKTLESEYGKQRALDAARVEKRSELLKKVPVVLSAFFANLSSDIDQFKMDLGLNKDAQLHVEYAKFVFAPQWGLLNVNSHSHYWNHLVPDGLNCTALARVLELADQLWTGREMIKRADAIGTKNNWEYNMLLYVRPELLNGIQASNSKTEMLKVYDNFLVSLFARAYQYYESDIQARVNAMLSRFEIVRQSFPDYYTGSPLYTILVDKGCPWVGGKSPESKKDRMKMDDMLSALAELEWPPTII